VGDRRRESCRDLGRSAKSRLVSRQKANAVGGCRVVRHWMLLLVPLPSGLESEAKVDITKQFPRLQTGPRPNFFRVSNSLRGAGTNILEATHSRLFHR